MAERCILNALMVPDGICFIHLRHNRSVKLKFDLIWHALAFVVAISGFKQRFFDSKSQCCVLVQESMQLPRVY